MTELEFLLQIMAVATLAAGTAHELGTPLSTMKILLDELLQDSGDNSALAEDLGILARQVEVCRSTLKKLVATADRNRSGLGIGLLLTHTTLNKFGGNVILYRRPQGGIRTEATLPAARKNTQDAWVIPPVCS